MNEDTPRRVRIYHNRLTASEQTFRYTQWVSTSICNPDVGWLVSQVNSMPFVTQAYQEIAAGTYRDFAGSAYLAYKDMAAVRELTRDWPRS